jgi:hypothetical protein
MRRSYFFSVKLSYTECQNLYQPGIFSATLRADSGERVQIPVKNLRPFVSSEGIRGRFRLLVDENYKLLTFDKIG